MVGLCLSMAEEQLKCTFSLENIGIMDICLRNEWQILDELRVGLGEVTYGNLIASEYQLNVQKQENTRFMPAPHG